MLVALALATSPPTPAGYSATQASGGHWVSDGLQTWQHAEGDYSGLNPQGAVVVTGGAGGNPPLPAGPGAGSCSGQVSITLTWNGGSQNEAPPPAVILAEDGYADWEGDSGDGDDGFGDEPEGGPGFAYSMGTNYVGIEAPGHTLARNLTPISSVSKAPGETLSGSCSAFFAVDACPVKITLGGVVDPKTDKRSAVGCRVSATVDVGEVGIPLHYEWTTTATQAPFDTHTFNDSASTLTPWNPTDSASTSMVFRAPQSSIKIRCRVYNDWYGVDVTVEETVNIEVPHQIKPPEQDNIGEFVLIQNDTFPTEFGLRQLTVGPLAAWIVRKRWYQKVKDADSVFLMSPNQRSKIINIQLALLDYEAIAKSTGQPISQAPAVMGVLGLDHTAPYYGDADADGQMVLIFRDTPAIKGEPDLNSLSSMRVKADFFVYLLYKPPTQGAQWVSIARQPWQVDGRAT